MPDVQEKEDAMRSRNPTEDDLKQYEANMRKIRVGGAGSNPTVSPLRRTSESLVRSLPTISEEEFRQMQARVSLGGVKEHTAVEAEEGEPRLIDAPRGTTVKSSARTSQATNGFKSKWEENYASKLDLEVRAGIVKAFWYEPISLWLPGKVRFKPDFLIQYPLGLERSLEIVEVKGWSRNLRDGMTRLKIAAALFPCFTWKLVRKAKGGGWEEETL